MEEKRRSCRAIIFRKGAMVAMYREKPGRTFYTFPGGGMEEGESEEECVAREVFEEFGLKIKPIKKVYTYENENSIQYFYTCKWLSGNIGDGAGEEYAPDRNKGVYKQTTIKVKDIPSLPLMPPEVAAVMVEDYKKNGESLRTRARKIDGSINNK